MHPLTEKILLALVPRIGYAYLRLCRATMRLEYRGREVLDGLRGGEPGNYILAFWHSRFAMMPYVYMMCAGLLIVILVPWVTLIVPRLLGLG